MMHWNSDCLLLTFIHTRYISKRSFRPLWLADTRTKTLTAVSLIITSKPQVCIGTRIATKKEKISDSASLNLRSYYIQRKYVAVPRHCLSLEGILVHCVILMLCSSNSSAFSKKLLALDGVMHEKKDRNDKFIYILENVTEFLWKILQMDINKNNCR